MPDNNKVHVYRASREDRLQRLVGFLWSQLSEDQQEDLIYDIHDDNMGWAIPGDRYICLDDWLTFEEVGRELGLTASAVRNWPYRYGLEQRKGCLQWGAVKGLMKERNIRRIAS